MIGVGCVREVGWPVWPGLVPESYVSQVPIQLVLILLVVVVVYQPNWASAQPSTNQATFYQNIYTISNIYWSKNLNTSLNYCCLKLEFTIWNETCYIIPSQPRHFNDGHLVSLAICVLIQKYSVLRINDLEGVLECLFHFGLYLNLTSGLFSNAGTHTHTRTFAQEIRILIGLITAGIIYIDSAILNCLHLANTLQISFS